MENKKAILQDWLKYAIIILIFLAIAVVILWQVYGDGLGIIKEPGKFSLPIG